MDAATREEVETLLTQLQQLLVGISIMQVSCAVRTGSWLTSPSQRLNHPRSMHRRLFEATMACLVCALTQDLTPRAKDSLVSFGERLSTRLFAAYLNAQGVPACQHDAFDIGVTTNDNFVNAEVGDFGA